MRCFSKLQFNPILSKGYYSNGNSIKGNASYEVSANSNCTVDATNVWWNITTSPYYDVNDFIKDGTSTISYIPARPSDPNPGRSMQSNPEENNAYALGTISLSMQAGDNDLISALDKQKDKKYDEAIGLYLNVFKNNKDVLLGKYALSKIEECFKQAGKKDYLTYSRTEIKPLLKEGSETYVVAMELETHQMVNAGLYKDAVNNLQTILKKYNLNSAIEKNTLFTLGAFYSLYFGDKDNSDKYFEELRRKYPKDELVNHIDVIKTFGTIANSSIQSAGMISFSEEAVTEIEKEICQDMVSNYPNPFNPTTKIQYALKFANNTKLIVYDVTGKEVANLVNGYQEKGKHEIEFDASKLSSGIYFYSIQSGEFVQTKKMMLLK